MPFELWLTHSLGTKASEEEFPEKNLSISRVVGGQGLVKG